MRDDQKDQAQNSGKKNKILREDDGKRTPPHSKYITGGDTHATRPEQGPHVPPNERTDGIP
ncbi:hypothetical protein POKO110462_19335 [Pontibacter korlensis]|uniref:Uncharacterized protein n=1 Tax=Pontibacter korlensis TaxID=400092 RepID=A0A0E3ZHJ7_9BACT|nr:hypothetical protein [Pontibacter korlensis]AKD04849.1 hypothetical protein PKOR_19265 [Pontibacter korlensis]